MIDIDMRLVEREKKLTMLSRNFEKKSIYEYITGQKTYAFGFLITVSDGRYSTNAVWTSSVKVLPSTIACAFA